MTKYPLFATARPSHDIQSHMAADRMNKNQLAKHQADLVLSILHNHNGVTGDEIDILAKPLWKWEWKDRAASKRLGGLINGKKVCKKKYVNGKALTKAKYYVVNNGDIR